MKRMRFQRCLFLFILFVFVDARKKIRDGNENEMVNSRFGLTYTTNFLRNVPRRKRSLKNRKTSEPKKLEVRHFGKTDEQDNEEKMAERLEEAETNYCTICDVQFKFSTHFARHYETKHPDVNPFACPHCARRIKTRKYFIIHMRKKHADPDYFATRRYLQKFTCELCRKEFTGTTAFEKHALSKHEGVKMMKCSKCDARFTRHNAAVWHERREHWTKGPDFHCNICKNNFFRSDDFERHVLQCRGKREKEANVVNNISIMEMEMSELRTICPKCGERFKSMPSLMDHMKSFHDQIKGTFACNLCEKSFASTQTLGRHQNKFHIGEEEEMRSMKKFRRERRFSCSVCGDEFLGITKYETHANTAHSDEKLFKCDLCSQRFHYTFTLRRHLKSQHGDAKLNCSHCRKSFAYVGDKNWHEIRCGKKMEEKRGKEQFFCHICRKIIRSSSLTHIKRHKYFDHCEFCDDRFNRKSNPGGLSKHVRLRHSDQSFNANALERAAHILKCKEEES